MTRTINPGTVIAASVVAGLAGFGGGMLFAHTMERDAASSVSVPPRPPSSQSQAAPAESEDEAAAAGPRHARHPGPDAAVTGRGVVDIARPHAQAGSAGDGDHETELRALRTRVRDLEQERRALLGEPNHRPDDATPLPPRFSSDALSEAFRGALRAEGVEGDVEGVDCSEYPCIVFGRLSGDEEDVEELERASSLAPYQDDVLTLLLWAVSAQEGDGRPGRAQETALFAIAYTAREDSSGDDRRIRARVMEVWNSDRPRRPALSTGR